MACAWRNTAPALIVHPPGQALPGFDAEVPGDVSSAAFFVTAALITGQGSFNPRLRDQPHAMRIHRGCPPNGRLGGRLAEERSSLGEPVGSITLQPGGVLRGAEVTPEEVPDLIDEIPLIAVLGLFAHGRTQVRGAAELRVKESDRLAMIALMAESLGGRIEVFEDGFAVEGPQALRPGVVDPQGDHRIAMAAAVAGAAIVGGREGARVRLLARLVPRFLRDFTSLGGEVA